MSIGKLIAWGLLLVAFIGTISELILRAEFPNQYGIWLSTYDLWYGLRPGNLVISQIWVESHLGKAAWDPWLVHLLALPIWLLFGLPGVIVIWAVHRRTDTDDIDAEIQEHLDSMALYDALARQARADGLGDIDAMSPTHADHDLLDAATKAPPSFDETPPNQNDAGK